MINVVSDLTYVIRGQGRPGFYNSKPAADEPFHGAGADSCIGRRLLVCWVYPPRSARGATSRIQTIVGGANRGGKASLPTAKDNDINVV